ncbi:MAG: hypothetical protein AB7O66_15285 [Limisphaerales bacterium]
MTPPVPPQPAVPGGPGGPGLDTAPSGPNPVVTETTEFMILPDGTIYARNLTPDLAAILANLNPHDATMALRAVPPAISSVP